MRTVALCIALASGTAGSAAAAQHAPPLPPDEVARLVLRADSSGDWATLLRLAHPDALIRFRALQTWQVHFLSVGAGPEVDSAALDTSQTHLRETLTRRERFLLDSVFQVPDVDSLAHTSPDSVLARWVRAAGPGDSAAGRPPRHPTYRVIGAIRESDTLAYVVVVRSLHQPLGLMPEMFRDFPREEYQPDVMTMRRHGGEWRSMLEPLSDRAHLSLYPGQAE
jgi:hypothetical protein